MVVSYLDMVFQFSNTTRVIWRDHRLCSCWCHQVNIKTQRQDSRSPRAFVVSFFKCQRLQNKRRQTTRYDINLRAQTSFFPFFPSARPLSSRSAHEKLNISISMINSLCRWRSWDVTERTETANKGTLRWKLLLTTWSMSRLNKMTFLPDYNHNPTVCEPLSHLKRKYWQYYWVFLI